MLVLGARVRAAVIAMLTYVCESCGADAAHRVVKQKRWFTLFFIPVFPIGSAKYSDTCVACGRVLRLTQQQATTAGVAPSAGGTTMRRT